VASGGPRCQGEHQARPSLEQQVDANEGAVGVAGEHRGQVELEPSTCISVTQCLRLSRINVRMQPEWQASVLPQPEFSWQDTLNGRRLQGAERPAR
jgi:hypothetical protein